jgi:hypothetical protein
MKAFSPSEARSSQSALQEIARAQQIHPHHDGMTAEAAKALFPRCPKGFAGSTGVAII